MKKLIPIVFTLLAGCASGPLLNASVINVNKQDLSKYWVPTEEARAFSVTMTDGSGKCYALEEDMVFENDKYAVFTFLIDSKGHIYERKYAKIVGEPTVNIQFLNSLAEGMGAIDATRYLPSSMNENKSPVRVQVKQYIVEKQGEC